MLSSTSCGSAGGAVAYIARFARRTTLPALQLLEAWRPVAQWVKENEPDTLAYEAVISESNPTHVMVFERCGKVGDRHGAMLVHRRVLRLPPVTFHCHMAISRPAARV